MDRLIHCHMSHYSGAKETLLLCTLESLGQMAGRSHMLCWSGYSRGEGKGVSRVQLGVARAMDTIFLGAVMVRSVPPHSTPEDSKDMPSPTCWAGRYAISPCCCAEWQQREDAPPGGTCTHLPCSTPPLIPGWEETCLWTARDARFLLARDRRRGKASFHRLQSGKNVRSEAEGRNTPPPSNQGDAVTPGQRPRVCVASLHMERSHTSQHHAVTMLWQHDVACHGCNFTLVCLWVG